MEDKTIITECYVITLFNNFKKFYNAFRKINNLKIEKYDENDKTITSVTPLDSINKTKEIARMLGNSTSENTLKLANEMIDEAQNFKKFVSN